MKRSMYWVVVPALVGIAMPAFVPSKLAAQHVAQAGDVDANSAKGERLLERRVTVDIKGVPLEQAIQTVAACVGATVMGDRDALMQYDRTVTLHVTNEPLRSVFERLFAGTTLQVIARPHDRLIVTAASEPGTSDSTPRTGTIEGRVTDSATGRGLVGVTIKVAGTQISMTTQDSGHFAIRNAPPGQQVLTFKVFGYRPTERTVAITTAQAAVLRVMLVSVPNVLSGVVTTATGVQRKIEVGNDITTLNVDSIQRVAPITSVIDLLESRVPGLTVVHSSGTPGDPSRLRLRGTGSIQLNNDPIVIVNGVRVYASQSDPRNQNLAKGQGGSVGKYNAPSPLDQIDPNNIETIEVLKGPSASATYGSDAANGVIVITTKHGHTGPTHWTLNLGAGLNGLPGDWPTNYYKFGANSDGRRLCNWFDPHCVLDSLVAFQALNDPRYTILSHGNDQDASLTISGGSQTLQYSLTGSGSGDLGYLKLPNSEQHRYDSLYGRTYGTIPKNLVRPDRYDTWSVNGQVMANPYANLAVQLSSQLFSGAQQRSALDGAINQLQGVYISPVFGTFDGSGMRLSDGPALIYGEYERATDDQLSMTNALSVNWRPFAWLPPVTATGGINTLQRNDVTYVPFGIYNGSGTPTSTDTTGSYGVGRGNSRDQTFNMAMQDIPTFRGRVKLAVGGNLHTSSTNDYAVYTNQLSPGVSVPTQFILPNCTTIGGGVCYSPSQQTTSHQSTYGWYAEPRLNVASKFFVAPGFRLDGGSGGSHSTGSVSGLSGFPKMDLSYIAVDRQDQPPLWGVLTLLRPRLAFGLAGTQPGPADRLRLYNVGSLSTPSVTVPGQGSLAAQGQCDPQVSIDGTTLVPAVCLNTLGNTQLRPERSSELEGGVDATLWRGRLSVTYTQYNKTRHDAILAIPVAPSVYSGATYEGATARIEKNIGVIRNTGTELNVIGTLLERATATWSVNANLSNDNNKVVRLNKGQVPIVFPQGYNGVQTRVQAGYPIFGEFVRPIAGFTDVNGDGVIESSEIRYGDSVVYIGQPNPKYQLNLGTDLRLLNGHLGLHATFAYQSGMTQDNAAACASQTFALLPNNPSTTLATQAAVVAAGCPGGNQITGIGLVQTVNVLRFNTASIDYELPRAVSGWLRVPRSSVALQGSNLALHTNYRGLDPNVNAFATVSAGDETADTGQIPQPRTWWLRFTLGN